MKINQKFINFIIVFLIQLVLVLPFYTLEAYGLSISNVRVANVQWNAATIQWDTDIASNSRVRYGTSPALGFTQSQSNFVTSHSVTVSSSLNSETQYYFSVESTDSSGSTIVDNNNNNLYNFTTSDITPPARPTGLNAVLRTPTSISLAWNNVNAADLANYKIYRNNAAIAVSPANSFNDTGLVPNTQYQYKVTAIDASNNEGFASDTLIVSTPELDTTEPLVSNVYVLMLADTTAKITWLTNENATSSVLYGVNNLNQAAANGTYTTNHSIILFNLARDSNYTYTINSCDMSNNCATLLVQSFIARQDTTPPFINIDLPRYVNRRVIDIVGFTEPFSQVRLFVNDMSAPKRILGSNDVGNNGLFSFSSVQLQDDNQVKIEAIDKSGNTNEAFFDISVDTQEPTVNLQEIRNLATTANLTIKGTVNEQVTVKVFVDPAQAQSSVPPKVTGLKATSIGQNSVAIEWNEFTGNDFSNYIIYRNNAAIATAKPSSYNTFIDALADSNKQYTYQVSAVNIFGNEGPKSDPLIVTTLQGGSTLNLQYPPVDTSQVTRVPDAEFNATGNFEFGIRIGRDDGVYNLKLVFEDVAQNMAVIENEITLDTKKPTVAITSPPSGALIYENVANSIDIAGTTDPNSKVHLYVDRTPFSSYDQSVQLTGLGNEVQSTPEQRLEIDINELPKWLENSSITEEELEANCGTVASGTSCTGADRTITADAQGNFRFEDVDLTALFAAAARLRNVPLTSFRDEQLNQEARNSRRVFLVVIATDPAGLHGFKSQPVRIGSCWSGNQSWDVIPLTQYQSPFALSTERMREGTEALYFYFNYSYIGRGTNPRITSVFLDKACGNLELIDPRFNISCKVLPSGGAAIPVGSNGIRDYSTTYSAIPLSRFTEMDRFTGDDFRSFFRALGNEMAFPFRLRITYDHDVIDPNTGLPKPIRETQTTCQEVSYVVDRDVIDPRSVMPDWLAEDIINFLDSSIKTMTNVQQQIDKLVNYVAVGCMASMGGNIVTKIVRKIAEFKEENPVVDAVTKLAGIKDFDLGDPEKNEQCKTLRDQVKAAHNGNLKLKYFSDADLQKCFPSVYSAWQSEEKFYKLERYSCDRIFGHSSPSGWTKDQPDDKIQDKINEQNKCANDPSARGLPLRAEKCVDINLGPYSLNRNDFRTDAKCFQVTIGSGRSLFELGDPVPGTNLYNLIERKRVGSYELHYAIKSENSEDSFITASPKSCEELCGIRNTGGGTGFEFGDGLSANFGNTDASGNAGAVACGPVTQCRSLNPVGAEKQTKTINGRTIEVSNAYPVGYSSKISAQNSNPCFYDGTNTNVVSDDPSTRRECCCINTEQAQHPLTNYYQPNDVLPYSPSPSSSPEAAHQSKTSGSLGEDDFVNMKWSYRYSRIGFEAKDPSDNRAVHDTYNPTRYIEGRDFPACFGQNSPFDRLASEDGKKTVVLNPFKNDAATLQCLYLTGVSQRLQLYKNIMSAMSNCLIEVRTTGRADSGVCKELFTQHVCGLVWQAIQLFNSGCTPEDISQNGDVNQDVVDKIKLGFRAVTEGISESQQELSNEYGNARMSNLLGTGTESVARKVCLAAFGYDWNLNARNLIDAAYTTPFATLVQAVTRSREFLTIDPITSRASYEYRASWLINPGCDIERYNVELACVSRKEMDEYPNAIDCNGIDCDCLGLTQEKRYSFFSKGNLKQNVLEEQDFHRVIPLDTRYDHLKFTLVTDRRIPADVKQNCFPTGFEKGVFYAPLRDRTARDITDCHADPLSGAFVCTGGLPFGQPAGTAELTEVTFNINGVKTRADLPGTEANVGNSLRMDIKGRNTGKEKCLRILITPGSSQPSAWSITQIGEFNMNDLSIIESPPGLRITNTREPRIGGLRRDNVDIGIPTNTEQIIIGLLFESDDSVFDFNDANDYLSIGGERKPITEWTSQNNGELIIQRTGATVRILPPINLNQPTRTGGKYTLDATIEIPSQQIAQTSQQKQVQVGIYNLRNDVESLVNPDTDCNFNNPVIPPRTYSFTLYDRNTVNIQVLPIINQAKNSNIRLGDIVNISVIITTPTEGMNGIREAKISFTHNNVQIFQLSDIAPNGDHFERIFVPDAVGTYTVNIQARSRTDLPGSRTFTFNVNPATSP